MKNSLIIVNPKHATSDYSDKLQHLQHLLDVTCYQTNICKIPA